MIYLINIFLMQILKKLESFHDYYRLSSTKQKIRINKMNFVWSEFGVLDHCILNKDGYLKIYNDKGEVRKMSPKYKDLFEAVCKKANNFKGQNVSIRTSQNTNSWLTSDWFSDVTLSKSNKIDTTSSNKKTNEIKNLKNKLQTTMNAASQLEEENKKLTERLIKASNKAEDFQAKYSLSEQRKAFIQKEYEMLSQIEKDDIDEQSSALIKMDIVGRDLDIQLKGHPVKLLALRQGIKHENRGRIKITVKKHCDRNYYLVLLPDYGNIEVKMALGYKDNILYVATLEPNHPKFRAVLEQTLGISEAILKQSADTYSLDEFVKIHEKIQSKLVNIPI